MLAKKSLKMFAILSALVISVSLSVNLGGSDIGLEGIKFFVVVRMFGERVYNKVFLQFSNQICCFIS